MAIPVHCAHDELVPIAKLKPNPANPNKHPSEQIALLAKIIKAQGWRNPIVVSNRSGLMTKGHARLAAATALGCNVIPVDRQDYGSEKEEVADMIADNRIAELAEADRTMLRELAEELDDGSFDMDLTGFDQAALEELMTAAPPASDIDAEPQINKAEELRQKWGVERGQIWQLGEHRLMCGDNSKQSDLDRILDSPPDLTITDPPYGVGIVNKNGHVGAGNLTKVNTFRPIYGDDKPVDPTWILSFGKIIIWGGNYFADRLPATSSWFIWDKVDDTGIENNFADCEIAWSNLGGPARIYRHAWRGMIRAGKREEKVHPTQKPVGLFRWCAERLTAEIIFDPYCGSAPAIIACEQLGRKCRAMEIDPGYVAVAIQRWVDATGKTPKLLK